MKIKVNENNLKIDEMREEEYIIRQELKEEINRKKEEIKYRKEIMNKKKEKDFKKEDKRQKKIEEILILKEKVER